MAEWVAPSSTGSVRSSRRSSPLPEGQVTICFHPAASRIHTVLSCESIRWRKSHSCSTRARAMGCFASIASRWHCLGLRCPPQVHTLAATLAARLVRVSGNEGRRQETLDLWAGVAHGGLVAEWQSEKPRAAERRRRPSRVVASRRRDVRPLRPPRCVTLVEVDLVRATNRLHHHRAPRGFVRVGSHLCERHGIRPTIVAGVFALSVPWQYQHPLVRGPLGRPATEALLEVPANSDSGRVTRRPDRACARLPRVATRATPPRARSSRAPRRARSSAPESQEVATSRGPRR